MSHLARTLTESDTQVKAHPIEAEREIQNLAPTGVSAPRKHGTQYLTGNHGPSLLSYRLPEGVPCEIIRCNHCARLVPRALIMVRALTIARQGDTSPIWMDMYLCSVCNTGENWDKITKHLQQELASSECAVF